MPFEEKPVEPAEEGPRAHLIEPASSGRAKCRGCGERIEKGELRFGERLDNPFADGDMTLWFHLDCGAFKRPESLLDTLGGREERLEGQDELEKEARQGIEHARLPRVNGAERASSGRAKCRSCHEAITKGAWRIPLVFWEEGRFSPSGFVHARCAREYLDTTYVMGRVKRFSPGLSGEELAELAAELASVDSSQSS